MDEGDEDREAEMDDDEDAVGSDIDLDLGDDGLEEGLILWNENHICQTNLTYQYVKLSCLLCF